VSRTVTVRVDRVTRNQLRELSRRYGDLWGSRLTMADVVRMGVSVLASRLEKGDAGGHSRRTSPKCGRC
jgi:hypothetical protein